MRSAEICTSVEAEVLELQCRKFFPQQPRKDPTLGKIVYPFKVSIHGCARVSKSYEDDVPSLRPQSMRDFGDEVHGETLDGFAQKPIGKPRIDHGTSSHKASFVTIRRGYAHVEISVRDHLNSATIVVAKSLLDAEHSTK